MFFVFVVVFDSVCMVMVLGVILREVMVMLCFCWVVLSVMDSVMVDLFDFGLLLRMVSLFGKKLGMIVFSVEMLDWIDRC